MLGHRVLALISTTLLLLVSCRFFEQGTAGNSKDTGAETRLGQGEGAEDGGPTIDAGSANSIIIVKTIAALPACDENTVNEVFYIESTQEYMVCGFDGSDYGFRPIDVDAGDVIIQNCPAADLLQSSEEIPIGDATCFEGLGGVKITIGCDLNGNDVLDADANPKEIADNSRDICNTVAPPQTTANLALALSSAGSDNSNCLEATPCLTFATLISKVPKTINHTVSIKIEAGMTLTEEVTVQGFTIGSTGKMIINSADDSGDWTIDGEDARDYGLKVEGVTGTGTLLIHHLTVTNANLAGMIIDSSVAMLGKITADSNGSSGSAAGILFDNTAKITTLSSGTDFGVANGPFPIVINATSGDGLRADNGADVTLGTLTVTSNSRDGINVTNDTDLTVTALTEITGSGQNAVEVWDSYVILTGSTDVNVPADTGGALLNSIGSAAVLVQPFATIELTDVRINSSTSQGISATNASIILSQATVNNNGANGIIASTNSTLEISDSAFENNTLYGISAITGTTVIINKSTVNNPTYFISNGDGGIKVDSNAIVNLKTKYQFSLNNCGATDTTPANGIGDACDNGSAIAIDIGTGTFTRNTGGLGTGADSRCESGANVAAVGCEAIPYCSSGGEPCDNPQN